MNCYLVDMDVRGVMNSPRFQGRDDIRSSGLLFMYGRMGLSLRRVLPLFA